MKLNKETVLFGGWGLILLIGFPASKLEYFFDANRFWALWIVLTLIGFGLMALTMNLRDRTMQSIFATWVVVVGLGLLVTAYMHAGNFTLYPFMGALWLGVIGLGHMGTSFFAGNRTFLRLGILQLIIAVLMALLRDTSFMGDWQLVITGLVGAAAMFYLILPRPALLRQRL
jgi:hypothetical protein